MTQTATREVTILARAQFKSNPKAAGYQVLSSNGADKYEVTVYNGKATSCTCPGGHGRCYHKSGCETYEAARKEQKFDVDCIHCRAHYPHTDEEHQSAIAKEAERTAYRDYEFAMGSYSIPGLY